MKRAIVVGSGPNGLSAAIALARAGVAVTVYEGAATPGGCARTEALTLPGFLHDAGAAVFPLGIASPFFQSLHLERFGLRWIEPDIPLAHPLDGGDAVAQLHSADATADLLGRDGAAWLSLVQPLIAGWHGLLADALGPVIHVPHHPLLLARFGVHALQPADRLARSLFRTERAQALFAGLAGHSNVPLNFLGSAAPAMMLAAAAHTTGWPIAEGGAGAITAALVAALQHFGGQVRLGEMVQSLAALPCADAILLDVTPEQYIRLSGTTDRPEEKAFADFQRSPGICKVDWALSAPIPWINDLCRRAGTVHLGRSLVEIARSEQDAWQGRANSRPYVLLAQPSLFDPTRAPAGQHTVWAYCHVPNGSAEDFTSAIEAQIERYAPGFSQVILQRHTRTAPAMQQWNPNLLGGDVSGGAMTLKQIVRRPTLPSYRTSLPSVFLCSSSTPPGGGVHGMCGWLAAKAAARHMKVSL